MSLDVISLAREAGVCFPDCHFLDVDPHEDLLVMMQHYQTDQEREDYLKLVQAEDQKRREKLHALELFAAAVLREGSLALRAAALEWQRKEHPDLALGMEKASLRMKHMAWELQEKTTVPE